MNDLKMHVEHNESDIRLYSKVRFLKLKNGAIDILITNLRTRPEGFGTDVYHKHS